MKITLNFLVIHLLFSIFSILGSEEICKDNVYHRYFLQRAWDEWNNNIYFNKAKDVLQSEEPNSSRCSSKVKTDVIKKRIETFKQDAFNFYPLIPILSDKFINHKYILPPEQIAIEDGMAEVRTVLEKRLIREGQIPIIILGAESQNKLSEFDLAFRAIEGKHPFAPFPMEEIIQNIGQTKYSEFTIEEIQKSYTELLKGFFEKDNWEYIYIVNIKNKFMGLGEGGEFKKYSIDLENEAYYILDVYRVPRTIVENKFDINQKLELVASADTTGIRTYIYGLYAMGFPVIYSIIFYLFLQLYSLFSNKNLDNIKKLLWVFWGNMLLSSLGMVVFLKFIPSFFPESIVNLKVFLGIIYILVILSALFLYIPFLNLILSKITDLTTILNDRFYYIYFIVSIFTGLSFTMTFYTYYFMYLNKTKLDHYFIFLLFTNRIIPGFIFSFGTLNLNKIHQINELDKNETRKISSTTLLLFFTLFLYSGLVILFYHHGSETVQNKYFFEIIFLIISTFLVTYIYKQYHKSANRLNDVRNLGIDKIKIKEISIKYKNSKLDFEPPVDFEEDTKEYINSISNHSLFILEVVGSPNSGKRKIIDEFKNKFSSSLNDKNIEYHNFNLGNINTENFLADNNSINELNEIKNSILLLNDIEDLIKSSTAFAEKIPVVGELLSRLITIKIPNLNESILLERKINICSTILNKIKSTEVSILEFYNYHEAKSEIKDIVTMLIDKLNDNRYFKNKKTIIFIHNTIIQKRSDFKSDFDKYIGDRSLFSIYNTDDKGFELSKFKKIFFSDTYFSDRYKENYDFLYKIYNLFQKDNKILISNFLSVCKTLPAGINYNESPLTSMACLPIEMDQISVNPQIKEIKIVHIAALLSETFDLAFFMNILSVYYKNNPEKIETVFIKEKPKLIESVYASDRSTTEIIDSKDKILERTNEYSNRFTKSHDRILKEENSIISKFIKASDSKKNHHIGSLSRFIDPVLREYYRNELFRSGTLFDLYSDIIINTIKNTNNESILQMEAANLIELFFVRINPKEKDYDFILKLFNVSYFFGNYKEFLVIYLLRFNELIFDKKIYRLYPLLIDIISLYYTDDNYLFEEPKEIDNLSDSREKAIEFINKIEKEYGEFYNFDNLERNPLLQFYLILYQTGKFDLFEKKIESILNKEKKGNFWYDYYRRFYLRIKGDRFKISNKSISDLCYEESLIDIEKSLERLNDEIYKLESENRILNARELIVLKARILQNKAHCTLSLLGFIPQEDMNLLYILRYKLYDLSGLFYTFRLFSKNSFSRDLAINKEDFNPLLSKIGEETCNRSIFKEFKRKK